jgi:hypothetical protein
MSADSEYSDIGQTELSLIENKHQIVYNFTINFIGVSIARSYGLGFDPQQGQDVSFLHTVQTNTGAYPASYHMGIRDDFTGGKQART